MEKQKKCLFMKFSCLFTSFECIAVSHIKNPCFSYRYSFNIYFFLLTDGCPSFLLNFPFAKVIFDYAMPAKCNDQEILKVLSLVRAAEDAAKAAI